MRRLFGNLVLFGLLFFAPWHFVVVAIFILNIFFPKYWEGVVAGLIMDSMYSLDSLSFSAGFGWITFFSFVLVFFSGFIRNKLRVFN